MEIIRTVSWMKEFARKERSDHRVIGLVPTMGALHDGHLALIRRARQECSTVVVSIFVNPTQFGPAEDFAKYPRDLQSDTEKLSTAGVEYVFLPEAAEVYPRNYSTYVTVEGLSERLEGRARPGHFRGVSTVVMKLLQMVQPDFAYFGRKDAQQVAIVARMVKDLNLDPEIVVCPIVREADGLAMSSRNTYLSADQRKAATVLHRSLQAVQQLFLSGNRDALSLQHAAHRTMESEPGAKLEYAEIVDAETFQPMANVSRSGYVLLAAKLGKTRLIDNLFIEFTSDNAEPRTEL